MFTVCIRGGREGGVERNCMPVLDNPCRVHVLPETDQMNFQKIRNFSLYTPYHPSFKIWFSFFYSGNFFLNFFKVHIKGGHQLKNAHACDNAHVPMICTLKNSEKYFQNKKNIFRYTFKKNFFFI